MAGPPALPAHRGATLKDVAERASVSTATASHVINGTRKVNHETRARVQAAIEALGYSGHSIAKSLRSGRTGMIGLLVSDVENPLFAMLAGFVQRAARDHGLQVIFGNSEEHSGYEREIIDAFSARRVDGIVIAPVSQANAGHLASRRIPVVVVNRQLTGTELPHVRVDDPLGAALGFEHLWALGHRRVAVLHGDPGWSTTTDRLKGVRAVLRRHRAKQDPGLLMPVTRTGPEAEATLADMLRRVDGPTAVLALNNSATLAAIRALNSASVRCPEDVSVVGYGVSSPYSIPMSSLSMVEQPVSAMAAAAVDLLRAQLAGGVVAAPAALRPTLTLGRSSAAVRAIHLA